MQRTFCDRPGCGNECTNYYAVLNVYEVETTSQGEELDSAHMRKPRQLCRPCRESLQDWFGGDLGILGEEAMAQLKQQRYAEEVSDTIRAHP